MKKTFLFLAILFETNAFGTQYVPLVTENVEWQTLSTTYPFEFQMAKTITHQIYTLNGDTVIGNLTYKKICLKTKIDEQTKYDYFGAIREQNKKIYYIGDGYFTSSPYYNISLAKVKAMKECLSSYKNDGQEMVLYDFNSKAGDYIQLGYNYSQIIYEDSVLVGNSYRRRLNLSNNDKIVEGIGSVMNGFLTSVTPMLMCSDYYLGWEFEAFMKSGIILYKATKNQLLGYQTVYSQRKTYYKSDSNTIETLKIDSSTFFNDSIFYPSRTLQLIGDECYDPKGGGWAGKKIVFENQWNYFFNDDNDTIKIKTDAVINENWILFRRSDITISATVTKWDTAMVLGVIDSVKTITLHVFDSSMKPTPHELENSTIALSKHYGLIKTLNFTYLPMLKYRPAYSVARQYNLVGMTNPELGVQNINWFDVFNFQEGDEFHYIESDNNLMLGGAASEKKYIIRILKRENFNDSIRYTEDVESSLRYQQNTKSDAITTYSHYQDTNLIHKNVDFDQDPGIPVFNTDSSRLQIYPSFNIISSPEIYWKENNCWRRSIVNDDACNFVSYAKGRGLINASSGCWQWQSYWSKEQVYYMKGSVTGGTPLVLTNNEEVHNRVTINVYPNPSTDKIYIDLNDMTPCTFELYDAKGKLVIQKELNALKNTVSIQGFIKGLYFYRLKGDGKQINIGKIIKD